MDFMEWCLVNDREGFEADIQEFALIQEKERANLPESIPVWCEECKGCKGHQVGFVFHPVTCRCVRASKAIGNEDIDILLARYGHKAR